VLGSGATDCGKKKGEWKHEGKRSCALGGCWAAAGASNHGVKGARKGVRLKPAGEDKNPVRWLEMEEEPCGTEQTEGPKSDNRQKLPPNRTKKGGRPRGGRGWKNRNGGGLPGEMVKKIFTGKTQKY